MDLREFKFFLFLFLFLVASETYSYKYIKKDRNGVYKYKKIKLEEHLRPKEIKRIDYFGPLEKNPSVQRVIYSASKKFRVDPLLIKAVIKAESNFKSNAVSHAGAEGIMQIMPSTAVKLGVLNSFNYKESIYGGTRYLRFLLNKFMGNMQLAVAAYNAGENAVLKYGTVPPFKETQVYVKKVISFYNAYLYEKFKKHSTRKNVLKKIKNNERIRLSENLNRSKKLEKNSYKD